METIVKTIIKLDIKDIRQIISNYFNVDIKNVSVIDCGNDTEGPYVGSGYYCDIEVEKND